MNIRSIAVLVVVCSIMLASVSTYTYASSVETVYKHYCTQCHGLKGDGKGPNAAQLSVTPRNHTDPKEMGKLSDKDIVTAIEEGGGAVGKSTAMPSWGKTLTKDESTELVKHLRKLCNCTGPK